MEVGLSDLDRDLEQRAHPPARSFAPPRTTIFRAALALAEGFARARPSYKPCAWMVTDHVFELKLKQLHAIGAGLSGALHSLNRARDTRRGLARRERNIGNLL